MARIRRILRRTIFFLGWALVVTVLVAWGCGMLDVLAATNQSADAVVDDFQWTVHRWDRPGATYVISDAVKPWPWGVAQATGAPDTAGPGDQQTAWASLTADGQREWLALEYASAVLPKSVRVYESFNPGAVDRVTVLDKDGREIEAWSGKDPTPIGAPSGVSDIPLAINFPIRKVKLYIDSPAVSGWNEIDAVALVSDKDQIQWARKATASSTYGAAPAGLAGTSAVKALLPAWGHLTEYDPLAPNGAPSASRAVDARGWPFPALWSERDPLTGNAIAGAIGAIHRVPASTSSAASSSSYMSGYRSGILLSPASTAKPSFALPFRPIWPGFLADVAFFSIALGIISWLLVHPRRALSEVLRMRKGFCINCGYDLGYNFPAGCPECGWRRIQEGKAEIGNTRSS